jgi:hypothetical protein
MQEGTLHTLLIEMIHEVDRTFNDSCFLQQIKKKILSRHKGLKVEKLT